MDYYRIIVKFELNNLVLIFGKTSNQEQNSTQMNLNYAISMDKYDG